MESYSAIRPFGHGRRRPRSNSRGLVPGQMKSNRVQVEFFRQLIAQLDKAGVSADAFFAELRQRGVKLIDPARRALSARDAAAAGEEMILLETAVELSRNPCLAVRLGQQVDIASYGSFGFALMSCANLHEAVALLIRYGRVLFEPSWTSFEHEGGLLLRADVSTGTPYPATADDRTEFLEPVAGGTIFV